jgi:hypothetical protein
MPGLMLTVEERAAQVRALADELSGYERRVAAAHIDKDEDAAEKWEGRAEQVREQLRLRGAEAQAPRSRAAKRDGRAGQEVRA